MTGWFGAIVDADDGSNRGWGNRGPASYPLGWGNALPDNAIKDLYVLLMTIAGKGFLYGL